MSVRSCSECTAILGTTTFDWWRAVRHQSGENVDIILFCRRAHLLDPGLAGSGVDSKIQCHRAGLCVCGGLGIRVLRSDCGYFGVC